MVDIMEERRPWGRFERYTLNEKSTVKLVYVDADKRLSLQYHKHRTEFWKVVKGPVKVQLHEKTLTADA
jgi:mannose-6-phosphate isomerase